MTGECGVLIQPNAASQRLVLTGPVYASSTLSSPHSIPELTEAITLQGGGPTEAARCVRKQLKYGSVHGQKRTLTILGALVENAGPRFQSE